MVASCYRRIGAYQQALARWAARDERGRVAGWVGGVCLLWGLRCSLEKCQACLSASMLRWLWSPHSLAGGVTHNVICLLLHAPHPTTRPLPPTPPQVCCRGGGPPLQPGGAALPGPPVPGAGPAARPGALQPGPAAGGTGAGEGSTGQGGRRGEKWGKERCQGRQGREERRGGKQESYCSWHTVRMDGYSPLVHSLTSRSGADAG
jgi:hypothetical protein